MTTYHAQPYNTNATGFYFKDLEDYQAKAVACRDPWGAPVEEFELQYIDGDDSEAALFSALGIDQGSIETWFDVLDECSEQEQVALAWLVSEVGYSVNDAREKVEDVCLQEGTVNDIAEERFFEMWGDCIPDAIRSYIDTAAFGRDLEIEEVLCEYEFAGVAYVITNANDF